MCRWEVGQAALFSATEWADRLCGLADTRQTAQWAWLFSHERKNAETVTRNHWETALAGMGGGLRTSNKPRGR